MTLQHVSLETRRADVDAELAFWALLGFAAVRPPEGLVGVASWVAIEAPMLPAPTIPMAIVSSLGPARDCPTGIRVPPWAACRARKSPGACHWIRRCAPEMGEVTARLDAHPQVARSAVVAVDDATGSQRLIGYVSIS